VSIVSDVETISPPVVLAVQGQTPSRASFPLSPNTSFDDRGHGQLEGERRVPLMISSEQEYYWTKAWQEGELEALAEINAGETHVFANPEEAVFWLLSDD
jgi:hypothetical protein